MAFIASKMKYQQNDNANKETTEHDHTFESIRVKAVLNCFTRIPRISMKKKEKKKKPNRDPIERKMCFLFLLKSITISKTFSFGMHTKLVPHGWLVG